MNYLKLLAAFAGSLFLSAFIFEKESTELSVKPISIKTKNIG
jgi:hypothetical protein